MNEQQRHKFEYLLTRLDDEDIDEAAVLLDELKQSRSRGYHLITGAESRVLIIPRMLLTLIVCAVTISIAWLMAAYHLSLVLLAAPLFVFYSFVALLLHTRAQKLIRA